MVCSGPTEDAIDGSWVMLAHLGDPEHDPQTQAATLLWALVQMQHEQLEIQRELLRRSDKHAEEIRNSLDPAALMANAKEVLKGMGIG